MSPLQIFVRGCLEPSTAMLDIFGAEARVMGGLAAAGSGELGLLVDWPERITVPDIQYTLEGPIMEQVQARFNPLSGPRGSHLLQIIRDLVSFLDSAAH